MSKMLRTSVVFTSSESDIALNYNTIHCTEQFSLEMGVKLIYQTESLAFAFTSGICGHTVWVTLLLGLKPRRRQETPFSHTHTDSHRHPSARFYPRVTRLYKGHPSVSFQTCVTQLYQGHLSSGGSRISPRWERQPPRGVPTYNFAKCFQKIA